MPESFHYVEDRALRRVVANALRDSDRRRLNREMRAGNVLRAVDAFLGKQPRLPDLVGLMDAAQMLGVPKPRVYRLEEQGRMPEPVAKLSSGPVYLRSEVQALADQLHEERAERLASKALRAAAS